MFSHIYVGSNDLQKSKIFYDAILEVIGAPPGFIDPKGRLIYRHKGTALLIGKPINGEPATVSNGATIGFGMESPEQANAWHAAGLAAGGTAAEDPPGWRESPTGNLYLAYLRDPDGHKLCAFLRE